MSDHYTSEHVITTKHYLVLSVTAFVAGILSAVLIGLERIWTLSILFFGLLSAVSVGCFLVKNPSERKLTKKYIILPVVLTVFFVSGAVRIYLCNKTSDEKLESLAGDSVWLYGTVASEINYTEKKDSCSFEMQVRGIQKNGKYYPLRDKIMIFAPADGYENLSFADSVECWADISDMGNGKTKDFFDYNTYLRGKNIFVTGKTGNINKCNNLDTLFPMTASEAAVHGIFCCGEFVRRHLSDAVDVLFAYNTDSAAILKGVLTGDKSGFSDFLYQCFSNAGITHIVAVSGMHLSILFSAISILLLSFRIHRRAAFLFSLPCIVVFMASAGFSPSICRAALMLLLMITATLLSGRYSSVSALFFALGVILFVAPYSIFSPGLLLSFGATFGILIYFKYLKVIAEKYTVCKVLTEPLIVSVALSVSAVIGTACFTILFFERLSWVQLFTNLWVIPLTFVVFCGGYIVCIAHYFLPPAIVWFLKLPVSGAVELVRATGYYFGGDKFAFDFSDRSQSPVFYIAYIVFMFAFYLLVKKMSDIINE